MIPATPRPMAEAITLVRMVPLAPTSVPATSSSTLPSTTPDAATASPVKALSREITIGTSAPPTGSTSSRPAASPSTSRASAQPARTGENDEERRKRRRPAAPAAITQGMPGKSSGRVLISSCSFPTVTAEPANETAPTSMVKTTARRTHGSSLWPSSSTATSAAAPPPTPLNRATSWGIWVICTRRATGTAIGRAGGDGGEDERDVVQLRREEHRDDGHERTGGADGVAAAGGPRRTEALERQDEADGGHEVEQGCPSGAEDAHLAPLPSSALAACLPRLPRAALRLVGLSAAEHLQHPVGDDEAADQVGRRKDDGDEGDRRAARGRRPARPR